MLIPSTMSHHHHHHQQPRRRAHSLSALPSTPAQLAAHLSQLLDLQAHLSALHNQPYWRQTQQAARLLDTPLVTLPPLLLPLVVSPGETMGTTLGGEGDADSDWDAPAPAVLSPKNATNEHDRTNTIPPVLALALKHASLAADIVLLASMPLPTLSPSPDVGNSNSTSTSLTERSRRQPTPSTSPSPSPSTTPSTSTTLAVTNLARTLLKAYDKASASLAGHMQRIARARARNARLQARLQARLEARALQEQQHLQKKQYLLQTERRELGTPNMHMHMHMHMNAKGPGVVMSRGGAHTDADADTDEEIRRAQILQRTRQKNKRRRQAHVREMAACGCE